MILTNALGQLGEEAKFLNGAVLVHTIFDMHRAVTQITNNFFGIYCRAFGGSIIRLITAHEEIMRPEVREKCGFDI